MPRGKKKDERSFWTTDCETDPFLHGRIPKPFLWGLYTGHSFHTFNNVAELVEAIKDQDVIVYAHNGGKFDFHYLLDNINLNVPITVINGRLVSAKIGKAEIRDSWNLLPVALSKIGDKLDIDYAKLEKKVRHLHMPEITRYMKADCVELWLAIDTFERSFGRHLTQAGAAMAQWKGFTENDIPASGAEFFADYSRYYYGGRVQCFRKGHINNSLKVYDIKSAYPWAMLSPHPYHTQDVIETKDPTRVFATSFLDIECVSNGALPFRDEKGNITFPHDNEKRHYMVCGHEYLAACETGAISRAKLIRSRDFVNQRDFSIYVNTFFKAKDDAEARGDSAMRLFYKLLLNSLYGKFCSNPDNYGNFMCVPFNEIPFAIDDGYEFDGMIGSHALMKAPLNSWQKKFINVATGASITSQVRAHLWRAINSCEGVAYCDTDSIICENAHLSLGDKLGEWAYEGEASEGWIAGKKLYALNMLDGSEKKASKGVRLDSDQIRRIATGETILAKNDAPTFRLQAATVFQARNVRMT